MNDAQAFDPQLLRRYDRAGPRYTSYPSAAQFSTAFGRNDYEAALARAHHRGGPLSVYVHVPFCESPCFYCACNRVVTRQKAMAATYLERLLQEIGLHAHRLGARRSIRQLHLGGGTPTSFDSEQLGRLMAELDRSFGLVDDPGREYSIEIDPRRLGPDTIADLAAMGFNRISIGVQDFDPAVQKAVNRLQSFEETRDAVVQARNYRMRSVGMDLICGLPRQTEQGFAETLDRAILLLPDRLSLYSYAHLPRQFKAQQRIDPRELPDAGLKLRLMRLAIERLCAAGYRYIGMDHFARPTDELARAAAAGRLQRNFQGYSTGAGLDLIGLGVSAISRADGCYAQNARQLNAYYAQLDHGHLPVERGLAPNADDRLRAELIESLMCRCALEFSGLEWKHGIRFREYFASELAALEPMARDGLVRVAETRLEVTPAGRYLLRAIAMVFDAYQAAAPGEQVRHSRVI